MTWTTLPTGTLRSMAVHANFFRVRQRTVCAIRQKFALLISNTNFGEPRFAQFQRLSVSIGRFVTSVVTGRRPRLGEKHRQPVASGASLGSWQGRNQLLASEQCPQAYDYRPPAVGGWASYLAAIRSDRLDNRRARSFLFPPTGSAS
jgi:hypothetical protein